MDTSASLLERLRQPAQERAWARFVELYTPLLYSWARRLGLHDADAADLVQDVLTLLVRKLPEFSYDPNRSFRAWLRTVTLNSWRNRRRRAELPRAANPPDLDDLPSPDAADVAGEAEYRRWLVGRALELMRAEFQPTTWKACWESAVNGRPAAEVAAELGISVGAVYMARSRVLSRLRRELTGLLD
ncbi:MAG TPA: sigma-70 family RNA polymerase sigma factor [Gemmataceae bacterium]|jgi:RNA polymerase sigma-70 factor (ECF subfamily)|nr:sigma-70 family RNA polymerase sigma factor [Gemmataceae bacterium]